ncbi:MAG: SpoIIE family protein phosphatase [Bacteroidales bacterium]|nr:SpoIIE family protein phosphatase [Bacteroidales bacterium]MDD4576662.1 SpoIIE family protein phosphatase [Bacteroidales bacterium]
MDNDFFIEINHTQHNHDKERICGDIFLTDKVVEENRRIAVLSDGMGHGVKANVLATLTAQMALNFTREHRDPAKTAETIIKTLPVCSVRKVSYSTFAIFDIEPDGKVSILEYENPQCIITRGGVIFEPEWQCLLLDLKDNDHKELMYCSFYAKKEDRIIVFSDGVEQSGLGSEKFPFGWPREDITEYILGLINGTPNISAAQLSSKIVARSNMHDNYKPKDDITCGVIYFRDPRKMLLCSGPPYEMEKDLEYAQTVKNYKGKKVLCGGTTADIIAKELKSKISDDLVFEDFDLPPISHMEGIDLITEGILTLSKVYTILKKFDNKTFLSNGPADLIIKMFFESDTIDFIIGTRINIAHQDPNLPLDLEIRRTVIKKIARVLEVKFFKEVSIRYI